MIRRMARHGVAESSRRTRPRPKRLVISLAVLLFAAVGLGIWWGTLRAHTDPISADPVAATATVVFSPSCGTGSGTVVDLVDVTPAVRGSFSGCGYTQGEVVAVQYLAGQTQLIRLTGSTTAGAAGAGRWLPWAILVCGVLAIATVLVLVHDRRRTKQVQAAHRVSVADLQKAVAEPAADETTRILLARLPLESAPIAVAEGPITHRGAAKHSAA